VYISQGFNTNGKIYVDRSGHMDTAVYEFEVDSLDAFFTWQRGAYANPGPEAMAIIECLNETAVEGYREIYEVIL
jgi:accessory colonization factor AcfC